MKLRRFVQATKGPYQSIVKQAKSREGVRHRCRAKSSGPGSRYHRDLVRKHSTIKDESTGEEYDDRRSVCFATTFGATLRTVLDFAGIDSKKKQEVAEALDDMASFFSPVAVSAEQISGEDRDHLLSGLATHRVDRRQSVLLSECEVDKALRKTWLYKSGQANVTLGATAAILVSHYVLAVTGSNPADIITNLTRSINKTRSVLNSWDISDFAHSKLHMDALGAEIRALERARASAVAAERIAREACLDRLSALHLQLGFMRRAAWPANAVCQKGESHIENLKRLEEGASIADPNLVPLPLTSSLKALSLLNRDLSEFVDDGSLSSSSSTCKSSSSSCSVSDWSSCISSHISSCGRSTYGDEREENADG